jgi:hypothetical protein
VPVTYVDPVAEEPVPAEPYERFLDVRRRPLILGLLANSFPDATNFTGCLELAIAGEIPGATFKRYQKPNVDPVAPDLLAAIVAECDGLVAVWGH